ncbi:hypothetical protein COT52_00400 [candidate division WWE3 bacterium CG08_land_8_20_14_0_20_43_13]|uniref:Methyltransferase type 11 domain-containing protein n=1 Tax=candidate division WWE3 bacterium CG08_land_8_20_14_0_20_43_13 TaxID=1975087 RepID=A0A2H0X838_UNCKA|nr:MAG: hypothetical protein COT52_00400 [candidate division WWE3 bacterium CG08_land_8_20_14_0_20_43_13]
MNVNYNQRVWGSSPLTLKICYLRYPHLLFGLKNLPKNKKINVLEVGCGGGVVTKAFKKYRPLWNLTGVDISKISLKKAKNQPLGVIFSYGDAYKLPFKENSWDGVLLTDVLEHLDDPNLALGEISRVLKKGGFLYLAVPLEGSLLTLHGILYKIFKLDLKKIIGHQQHFTKKEVEALLKNNGFRITNSRYSYHLLYQISNIIYFILLNLLKKDGSFSLENKLAGKKTISAKIWYAVKSILAILINCESLLLKKLPGQTLLLISEKYYC